MSRIFFLSMRDVKIFLTFTSPNMVLLWQLFYLNWRDTGNIGHKTQNKDKQNENTTQKSTKDEQDRTHEKKPGVISGVQEKCGLKLIVVLIFLFISSNIPVSLAYGVYISQLIHYSRACAQYNDFLVRVLLFFLSQDSYCS
jgi:hypothetical protein